MTQEEVAESVEELLAATSALETSVWRMTHGFSRGTAQQLESASPAQAAAAASVAAVAHSRHVPQIVTMLPDCRLIALCNSGIVVCQGGDVLCGAGQWLAVITFLMHAHFSACRNVLCMKDLHVFLHEQ